MYPALTWDPPQPVVELCSREPCKVAGGYLSHLLLPSPVRSRGNGAQTAGATAGHRWTRATVPPSARPSSTRSLLGAAPEKQPLNYLFSHFWPRISCTRAFVHVHSRRGACGAMTWEVSELYPFCSWLAVHAQRAKLRSEGSFRKVLVININNRIVLVLSLSWLNELKCNISSLWWISPWPL